MEVLITGANGFLGYYLTEKLLGRHHRVVATGKGPCRLPFASVPGFSYREMDFTDPFQVHDVFASVRAGVVVHAGAISKVDDCEQQQWMAYETNTMATLTLLNNAEELRRFFIYVSTDFIFDGEGGMYREEDAPGPVNYYGRTKLEAEEAVREYPGDWSIVRTVLVYGKPQLNRGNILSVVRDKLTKGEEYKVVDDQVRTPTFVGDLADGIVAIIENRATGVYHLSGDEVMTPYQMACRAADYLGLNRNLLQRVTQADFSQPARRPLRTGFNIDKARRELGYQPVSFEQGLKQTFS